MKVKGSEMKAASADESTESEKDRVIGLYFLLAAHLGKSRAQG